MKEQNMPKNNHILTKRNRELNELYVDLTQQGYSNKKILATLSEKFFLAERTIYGIVSGEYERRKQNNNAGK